MAYEVPFAGRIDELRKLDAAYERACDGHGSVLRLSGEPGIGKTRLSEQFARGVTARGGRVLGGKCYEGEWTRPFSPFAEALTEAARDVEPTILQGVQPELAVLRIVAPALAEAFPGDEQPPPAEGEAARFRMLDAAATVFSALASDRPLVLILDDLHWADHATLAMLDAIARTAASTHLLVLATYRDTEASTADVLVAHLASMRRDARTEVVRLGGLDVDELANLLALAGHGETTRDLVQAVFTETGGNPLFVRELLLNLAEERVDDGARPSGVARPIVPNAALSQTVRDIIEQRLSRLDPNARNVLTIAAAFGGPVDWKVMEDVFVSPEGLFRSTPAVLLDALELCMSARILDERGDGLYQFSHALIKHAVYGALSTPRRALVHRHIGESIERVHASALDLHLHELADHFCLAAPAGDDLKAVGYISRAADLAVQQAAYEEASSQYGRAIDLMQRQERPDALATGRLRLRRGEALISAGRPDEGRADIEAAVDIARTCEDAELLAHAALAFGYGGILGSTLTARTDDTMIAALRDALRTLPSDPGDLRAQLLARLAIALSFSTERHNAEQLSREAIDMALAVGSVQTRAAALMAGQWVMNEPGDVHNRLEIANDLIEAAAAARLPSVQLEAGFARFMCLFELCELEQAQRELDLQEAQAREQRLPFHTRTLHLRRATIATLRGRYEEAERTAQDCLRSGQEMNITAAPEGFGAQLISIRRDQGRVAEIDPVVKLMTQRFPETPVWRAGYSLVCTELERLEEAREWFDAVIRDGVDRISRDVFWLPAIAALADTCWYIRDATAAASLYVLLMPYKGRLVMGSSGMICWGFVDRLLGLLAGVMQHHELACRHLEESIALHKRGQALPWLARSQLELAELLVGDGTRGDAPRARTLATESRAVAQSIGMRALEGRTERLLDQLAL